MARVVKDYGSKAFQYSITAGLPEFREYIADRYNRRFNMGITKDDIIITTGSQQALDLLAKSMIDDLAIQCSQLGVSMKNAIEMDFQNASAQLKKSESMLRALNPRNVLSRGYSILFDAQHHAVRNALSVAPGDELHAVLAEGEIDVKVERQM